MVLGACHDCKVDLLETAKTVCLASGSNAGTRIEGGMNNCGRLNDGRGKGVLREASYSWYGLVMSNGEHKDCCKHSVGRPEACKSVHKGDTRSYYLLQRRGQEGMEGCPMI